MAELGLFQESHNRLRRLSLLRDAVRMEYEEAFASLPQSVKQRHFIGQRKGDPNLWETLAAQEHTAAVHVCRFLSRSLQGLIHACMELVEQADREDPAHAYNLSLKKHRKGDDL